VRPTRNQGKVFIDGSDRECAIVTRWWGKAGLDARLHPDGFAANRQETDDT